MTGELAIVTGRYTLERPAEFGGRLHGRSLSRCARILFGFPGDAPPPGAREHPRTCGHLENHSAGRRCVIEETDHCPA
jgi:hypothetical protein